MTTDEVIKLKQESRGTYMITERRIAQARIEAEIISILQKNNFNYTRACALLNDCADLIGKMAKF